MSIVVRLLHPQKQLKSILVTASGMVIDDNFSQPKNACPSNLVMVLGSVTLAKFLQSWKRPKLIVLMLLGIVMDVSPVPSKTPVPSDVTLLGIVMAEMPVPEKALFPIEVTLLGIMTAVIFFIL